jgi:RimJ/RimL family protein N-acetyltransferase
MEATASDIRRTRLAFAAHPTTMPRPVLVTQRLELVPLTDDHLELEIELDSDPEVLRYLDARAQTPAEVESSHRRRTVAADEVTGLGFWVGFVAGEFVGWWTLGPPHGPDQRKLSGEADLGYRLMRRWWRHGLASEGSRELLRNGFDDLALNRIFAQTLASNQRSRAVMEWIGLHYVRGFSSNLEELLPWIELGEVEYAITRQQWQPQPTLAVGLQRHRATDDLLKCSTIANLPNSPRLKRTP